MTQLLLVDNLQPDCGQNRHMEESRAKSITEKWSWSLDQTDPEGIENFQLCEPKNFRLLFKPVWVNLM